MLVTEQIFTKYIKLKLLQSPNCSTHSFMYIFD